MEALEVSSSCDVEARDGLILKGIDAIAMLQKITGN